jgi:hypothetical protein
MSANLVVRIVANHRKTSSSTIEKPPSAVTMLLANSNGNTIIKSIKSSKGNDDNTDDPVGTKRNRGYRNMNVMNVHQTTFSNWTGKMDFLKAQAQVALVLVIASVGNLWPNAYQRNDNHNPTMFWFMNAALLVASIYTLKHDKEGSARGVQLLSRAQTEEWKGWMQWAFIMVRVMSVCTRRNGASSSVKECVQRERERKRTNGSSQYNCAATYIPTCTHACLLLAV